MEITYTKVGDYLIPDLTLPPEKEQRPIGVWGKRHKRYLMEHKKAIFTIMQMNGTLQTYLADLNERHYQVLNIKLKHHIRIPDLWDKTKKE